MDKNIIEQISDEAVEKSKSKFTTILLLGILAGVFIAIGAFASTIASYSIENISLRTLVAGAIFPIGLILVTICGADLFTGRCLLVTSVLDKKITVAKLIKVLSIVYLGNLIGSLIFAILIFFSKVYSNPVLIEWVINVASSKASISPVTAVISGLVCNIIVCLAVFGAKKIPENSRENFIFILYYTCVCFVWY